MDKIIYLTEEQRARIARIKSRRYGSYLENMESHTSSTYLKIRQNKTRIPAKNKMARPIPQDTIHIPGTDYNKREQEVGKALEYLFEEVARGNTEKRDECRRFFNNAGDDFSLNFLAEYVQKYDAALDSYKKVHQSPLARATQNLMNTLDDAIEGGRNMVQEAEQNLKNITQRIIFDFS